MTEEYRLERISLQYADERADLTDFLSRHGLHFEDDIEFACGIFDADDRLCGCGCAAGSLLKCFAVEEELRGQNALGLLVPALTADRFAAGYYDLFVITRLHNEALFSACGFFPVVRTDALVMLENRPNGPECFAAPFLEDADTGKRVGSIVMNCNPFTLGHRALIEYAAAHCDILHLFVVEENRSEFPTETRFRLVREGTADFSNVRVHLSGHYMISAATFPTYFLKAGEDAAALQTELDIRLFAERIAPALHISVRFAGEEPLDPTTAAYNAAMRRILPKHGIEFLEIPRRESNGSPISASRVRTLLHEKGVCPEVLALVPETTARYLKSHLRQDREMRRDTTNPQHSDICAEKTSGGTL